jgi:hypothetical protein
MYIVLRDKYKFTVTSFTKDCKWLYFTGYSTSLLGNRIITICRENTFKNNKLIFDKTKP